MGEREERGRGILCLSPCTHSLTSSHTHARTHTHMHTHTRAHTHMHTHTRAHTHTHTHTQTCDPIGYKRGINILHLQLPLYYRVAHIGCHGNNILLAILWSQNQDSIRATWNGTETSLEPGAICMDTHAPVQLMSCGIQRNSNPHWM